jgi:hypothetical protein
MRVVAKTVVGYSRTTVVTGAANGALCRIVGTLPRSADSAHDCEKAARVEKEVLSAEY